MIDSDDLVQRIARQFRLFEPNPDDAEEGDYVPQLHLRSRTEVTEDVLPLVFAELLCIDCGEQLHQQVASAASEEVEFYCQRCDVALIKVKM